MLSEYERRELALIEQGLVDADRRLAESFGPSGLRAPGRRRIPRLSLRSRLQARVLLGFAVLLVVVGILTGADGLFMQGLLFGGGAVLWLRWLRRVTAQAARDSAPHPAPGTRPA